MVFDISKRFNRRLALLITLIMISFCPILLSAQDSLNVRFVGGYPFGSATGGIVSGLINGTDYVVVSSGSGILVFDVDDPANPAKVGQIISPIKALVPFLHDTLLYIAAQKQGLWIYNVADPSNPVMINRWQPNDSIVQVYVCQNSAYVVSYTRMTILDVSDPHTLVVQGEWTPDSILSYYVYVKDNRVYVCAACAMGMNDAMLILDVSDPALPYELGRCYLGQFMEVIVEGDYAYVTGWGLRVVDISDPANPYVVRDYLVDFPVGNPQLKGDCLYVGGMFLYVFDIIVPDDPILMNCIPCQTTQITVLHDYLYSMAIDRIEVLDITEPFLPFQISEYEIMYRSHRIEVSDNFAVFCDPAGLFRIIDVTDPQNCFELGKCDINYRFSGFTMAGNNLYVAAHDSGMRVIDISDLANPHEIGHCYIPGLPPYYSWVRSVCVQGNYAYLGCSGSSGAGGYGFAVCDIADPANPYLVTGIPYGETLTVWNVVVAGDFAYCSSDDGLRIVNISNPYAPTVIAGCDLQSLGGAIYVSDNYVYLNVGYDPSYLWIIDVSDPYNPLPVSYYYPMRVNDIYVEGIYAYLSDDLTGGGVRIFDVSNPVTPQEVGYYRYKVCGRGVRHSGVSVQGGLIYTAAGDCGLWILDPYGIGIAETGNLSITSRLKVSTIGRKVELSYLLDVSSAVTISLLDVCGRVVDKFEDRVGPGMHNAGLQPGAAGVYFLRVETDEWVETRKIILIR